LNRIAEDEERHVEFWFAKIEELEGEHDGKPRTYFRDLKMRLLMGILGTKGFFEWAIVGEDEGIQELALQAGKIRDQVASETWSRYASDERMHLERVKTDVLGMETWEIRGGGGVRDLIFGANDGLVSTLAFVTGVVGATTDPHFVLLSGIAELFAGTISMGFGSYQSSKSELEVWEKETQRKKVDKGMAPEDEREALIQFYQSEGFTKGEAEAIVKKILADGEPSIHANALEEIGLAPEELGNPLKAGVVCGGSFGLAALVPLLPFAFGALNCTDSLIVSTVATLATLFGVGASKTIFSRKNWVRSGLEMMIIGASGAAITYIIGNLFSLII
jgi:VIT1/CCC1 family predicted Fe2+/Mn2+ transporter